MKFFSAIIVLVFVNFWCFQSSAQSSDLTRRIQEHAASFSDDSLIAKLNQPTWTWLVFQYDRSVAIEEAYKRVRSTAERAGHIARLICVQVTKAGLQNQVISEIFRDAVLNLADDQISENLVRACERVYRIKNVGEMSDSIRETIGRSQAGATWSPVSLLLRLSFVPADQQLNEAIEMVDSFLNAPAPNVIHLSEILMKSNAIRAVEARKTLLNAAVLPIANRNSIVDYAVDKIRAGYPSLHHVTTDIAIVNQYADPQTQKVLLDRMIQIARDLRREVPQTTTEMMN